MFNLQRSRKGFSLLELIVVIVILALLAALAIPTFSRVIDKSKDEVAGASLSAVARNAQALRAVSNTDGYLLEHVKDSVDETYGTQAAAEGLEAAGKFSMAAGYEDVKPGNGDNRSTKYGEVAWSLSSDSRVIGLAMKSTTNRCVFVKTAETASTTWMISKEKMTNCPASEALLIEGPDGGTHTPGEENPPAQGGEDYSGEDILGDPSLVAPDVTLPVTGEYCVDNNCAAPVLLNAPAFQTKLLTPETDSDYQTQYEGLVVDSTNQRLIASRNDGIYFVNWSTGEATKVSDVEDIDEMLFFKPNYLFGLGFFGEVHMFQVTNNGLTEISEDLIGGANPDSYAHAATLAGDVVGSGAQIYMGGMSGNLFDNEEGVNYIGKSDINGNLQTNPVVRYSYSDYSVCSMSVDKNYLYLNVAWNYLGSWTLDSSGRSGIYRINKNASNVRLSDIEPWAESNTGCTSGGGSAQISALGDKILGADGISSAILSYDKDTAKPTLMAGGGSYTNFEGTGREVTFKGREFRAMTAYKNRAYAIEGDTGRILVMAGAKASENNIDTTRLTLTENTPSGPLYVEGPPVFTLAGDASKGQVYFSNSVTAGVFNEAGELTRLNSRFRPGNAFWLGDRVMVKEQIINIKTGETATNTSFDNPAGLQCAEGSQGRNAQGVYWCVRDDGFYSYEIPSRPLKHPVRGLENLDPIVRISFDGSKVFLVTFNDSGSYKIYNVNLAESNPAAALIDTVNFAMPSPGGQFNAMYLSPAVSADAIYLPVPDGVIKAMKTGGHSLAVHNPSEMPVISVAHDGKYLYFGTDAGNGPGTVYRVD